MQVARCTKYEAALCGDGAVIKIGVVTQKRRRFFFFDDAFANGCKKHSPLISVALRPALASNFFCRPVSTRPPRRKALSVPTEKGSALDVRLEERRQARSVPRRID